MLGLLLSCLLTRKLAIYSKTSITILMLTLTLLTAIFEFTHHHNLYLNPNLNFNIILNLTLKKVLNDVTFTLLTTKF